MPLLRKIIILFFLFNIVEILSISLICQEVPQAVNNYGIYEFLDELANINIIEINSAIKPYSRLFIANRLREAEGKRDKLSNRQQKELDFYMLDFGKEEEGRQRKMQWLLSKNGQTASAKASAVKGRRDLFYYRDSLFSITVNPILGGEIFNNSSGNATYWRNGLEARAYIQNWGFYASLRDNHETPLLGLPQYLSQRTNGHMKEGNSWEEMQGGVTYAWKWGSAGLVKDGLQWGNNYNGANIFGGNNPTFVQLRLHINPVKWFDFNYFHGWLNSMVIDSARSYWVNNSYGSSYREVNHKKFIAANMFTITPFKNLNVSAGNSIVYTDLDLFPAYLIPVFFYKAVDHSVNSGIDNMNSQMFFDISSRQIKNLHLYATMFIDELSVARITKKDEWNFFSYKAGFRLTDFPVSNLSFTTEFTYTYPLTYQHYVPTITFESNGYNLGHYMRDNSREWYFSLAWRPMRTMNINLYFIDAIRGPDYNDIGGSRIGNPPLAPVEWHNTTYGLKASYQIINDVYSWCSYAVCDVRGEKMWSPEYFFGKKNTVNLGVTVGF
jgi:hypothetical protein